MTGRRHGLRIGPALLIAVVALSGFCRPSIAWDEHRLFVPEILRRLPPEVREKLNGIRASRVSDYRDELRERLLLSPRMNERVGPIRAGTTGEQLLLGTGLGAESTAQSPVDEPDFGMDQDLPDAISGQVDPRGARRFMGGVRGPTSQGFRHMHFPGWTWRRPIESFQVPLGEIGEARERIRLLSSLASEWLRSKAGDDRAIWGVRLLGWALHYAQDLEQPFHRIQIPSLRMVPWGALFSGSPFQNLVKETTRTIGNYHYAFEAWVKARGISSCHENRDGDDAQGDAHFGSTVYGVFGDRLKAAEVDLPRGVGSNAPNPEFADGPLPTGVCVALERTLTESVELIRRTVGDAPLRSSGSL